MENRKKIFIIIGVVAALILVFALVLVITNREEAVPTQPAPTQNQSNNQNVVEPAPDPAAPLPIFENAPVPTNNDTPDEQYVQQISRTFVERFGSYSNQNDNRHIVDAKALSTASMQEWLDTQVVGNSFDYSGVTTRVIATSVVSLSETNATVRIGTQQFFEGADAPETNYRSGRVELVFINNDWKVDGFFWETE